jgi:hypothetical protein
VTARKLEIERRRAIYALGMRALDYYVDTGLCVFCNADDVQQRAHDDDCWVGEVANVVVDDARRTAKAEQRAEVCERLALLPSPAFDNILLFRRLIRGFIQMNADEYKASLVVDGAPWRVLFKADRARPPRKKQAKGRKP